jgi:two-component system cell cycle response regulator
MSARILIVDDVAFNIKLLGNRLKSLYYDVFTATSGFDAIAKVKEVQPDLILMDVMMPDIDGIEATKRIKAIPEYSHIPIVMITALNSVDEKINALMSGADDFLTKPLNKDALLIRVKSLLRMKFAADELRMRGEENAQINISLIDSSYSIVGSEVMVVDDDDKRSEQIKNKLIENGVQVDVVKDPEKALKQAITRSSYSMIIISTQLFGFDGLRLCSRIKSNSNLRNIPLTILVAGNDNETVERALDIGVQDYILAPVEPGELIARVSNQLIRKQLHDRIRQHYIESISLSMLDPLTNLHNRRYLDTHLEKLLSQSLEYHKSLAILMLDLDNFKQINDKKGHAAGDLVLKEVAGLLTAELRVSDLCVRYGGDEFIVVLPNTNIDGGYRIAERILHFFQHHDFAISSRESVKCHCSIGVTQSQPEQNVRNLLKKVDDNLYQAKKMGRNCVYYSI